MKTWFIADLHLDANEWGVTRTFLAFLSSLPRDTDGLYILGDFFEYWVGDDVLTSDDCPIVLPLQPVFMALRELSERDVPIYLQHGNRDFLLGDTFAQTIGCQLLPEQCVVDLYGTPTLLMHGDQLCTDDSAYQQVRAVIRQPAWQQAFLAQPLAQRITQAQAMRAQSRESMQGKMAAILDVNQAAVDQAMTHAGVDCFIHGHTHRPAIHTWAWQGVTRQRVVLGDWHDGKPSYLCVDSKAINLTF